MCIAIAGERERVIALRANLAERVDALCFDAYFPCHVRTQILDMIKAQLAKKVVVGGLGPLPAVVKPDASATR